MRSTVFWIALIGVMLLAGGTGSAAAQPSPPAQADGVVRAVLFWRDSCPHCHIVIDQVLPPLQQQYGAQLEIRLLEASSEANARLLQQAATTFGIPLDQVGVPFLVIGDRVLIGSDQIPAELPGLIAQHLTRGGVEYPQLPGLAEALSTATPAAAPAPRPEGFGLAIATIGGMLIALLATGLIVWRGLPRSRSRRVQRGARAPGQRQKPHRAQPVTAPSHLAEHEVVLPTLTLGGLGIAGYLAYVETQAVATLCGPVGDCNAVQSSPYAYLFGVLPIGVLGVVAYLSILAVWLWGRMRDDMVARYAPLAVFGLALVGTLFSFYLTYLEAFVIEAICAWCLTSAVVITLLLIVSARPSVQAYARLHQ
jgi:uncharacterized membrane protein